ncbi:hypothetical protein PR048_032306 [Dryococelus australis]|uniref:Uncharacterized protein n=1 Tax=Dryococelus australis TaxID=614101 RepID=A0ABQ9G2P1_9NEOP|nr:hypothetical protein PR048_032306 [Dryococelus australis]
MQTRVDDINTPSAHPRGKKKKNKERLGFVFRFHQRRSSFLRTGPLLDFRKWESWQTMPLVAGFSRRSPSYTALSFRRYYKLDSITLIGSQDYAGAAVAERLARSPPTKAYRVQSSSVSPDVRKWKSCRTMPLVGDFFLGEHPFPPPLHSGAAPRSLQSSTSALKTSLLIAAQIRSLTHSLEECLLTTNE